MEIKIIEIHTGPACGKQYAEYRIKGKLVATSAAVNTDFTGLGGERVFIVYDYRTHKKYMFDTLYEVFCKVLRTHDIKKVDDLVDKTDRETYMNLFKETWK